MFILMAPFFVVLSLIFLFFSMLMLGMNFSVFIHWIFFLNSFYVSFPIFLDFMSCMFMSLVLLISGSIIFYCEFYMAEEIYKSRFFYLMLLFIMSMMFLIICPNMFCMLLGWDGLGLISFCLVMYYQNFKSFSSSMITALTNRVGDVFILASISMNFSIGSWSYMNFLSLHSMNLVIVFFLISAFTKSAQVPFSAWLPAAMAAPTPVSSLVHSSTLVTAGVYILIRYKFYLNNEMKFYLMMVSLLTMIMSGVSGVLEYDLKKIIALSTLSQLGFMMFCISFGYSNLAFFHLITHASFKALLFMCAGIFIHQFINLQDIRCYGYMDKSFSFCVTMFNVANLSLCGFPFLSGFFSKDLVLELCLMNQMNLFYFSLVIFGTFLTVFYSFRLFIFLCMKNLLILGFFYSNMKKFGVHYSLILLYIYSVILGYMGSKLIFLPYNYIILPFMLKVFILMICLLSFLLSFLLSSNYFKFVSNLLWFLSQMWFMYFLKTDFFKSLFFKISLKFSYSLISFIENFFGCFFGSYINKFSLSQIFFFFKSFLLFFYFFFMFLFLILIFNL